MISSLLFGKEAYVLDILIHHFSRTELELDLWEKVSDSEL